MAYSHTPTLISIPAELTFLILNHLSSYDFIQLRQVCRSWNAYFTSDEICAHMHRVYFPRTSEITKPHSRPYASFPDRPFLDNQPYRTRKDFDSAYMRAQNFKTGQPTNVEVISEVAEGCVANFGSTVVNVNEGLLVYPRSLGVMVIRDLNKPLPEGAQEETVLNLKKVLGGCIVARTENPGIRDGESILAMINRGRLFIVGEAHAHHDPEEYDTLTQEPWYAQYWPHLRPTTQRPSQRPPRPQGPTSIHTMCAVFSLEPRDRGKLLYKWMEDDHFIGEAALNQHYCLMDFNLVDRKQHGIIYRGNNTRETKDLTPAHHFTIEKKRLYPAQSSQVIAADTKGKVFFLGFVSMPNKKPVVEVWEVPHQLEDGSWTPPTVIKRVTLRTLANHVGGGSYWIDFVRTFEVNKHTHAHPEDRKHWKDGEDVALIRMKGTFGIDGVTDANESIKCLSWFVTARPSPRRPSSITDWRNGIEWELPIPSNGSPSPWADDEGRIDLEECYPTPSAYSISNISSFSDTLTPLPKDVDLERASLYYLPYVVWMKDQGQPKTAYGLLYKERESTDIGAVTLDYPKVPGVNDSDFQTPGRDFISVHYVALEAGRTCRNQRAWKEIREKAQLAAQQMIRGRALIHSLESCSLIADPVSTELEVKRYELQYIKRSGFKYEYECTLPLPGAQNQGLRGTYDWVDKRFLVYGKGVAPNRRPGGVAAPIESRIVIVRFD